MRSLYHSSDDSAFLDLSPPTFLYAASSAFLFSSPRAQVYTQMRLFSIVLDAMRHTHSSGLEK